MGTRLYPMTTDEAKLEDLAGVSRGSYASMRAIEKANPEYRGFLDALDATEDERIMHDFLLFGWGRVAGLAIINRLGYDYACGETTNPQEIRAILEAQLRGGNCFFDLEEAETLCEGVLWA